MDLVGLGDGNIRCSPQRQHELREVLHATRWMVRSGSLWRMMPTNFPPVGGRLPRGIELVVVKLAQATRGFVLLPKRGIVERSFAWATHFRRLSKDDERLPEVVKGCISLRLPALRSSNSSMSHPKSITGSKMNQSPERSPCSLPKRFTTLDKTRDSRTLV